ncbi:hypothetical protein EYC55_22200 [Xanthomonas oryzae]|nr:hypothetical protein EYC55_22200 [Xanthomonas oryzae]QBH01790.1 hypothetical protein EYC56_01465 [Xanthomonas oryzae]
MQAGTASACIAAQDVDQTLALDSIVFEWTATATYLMSYVDHAGRGQDALALNLARADSNAVAQTSPELAASAFDLKTVVSRTASVSGSHAGGTGLLISTTLQADTDAAKPAHGSSSASLGALAEWMSRSLKHVTDAEGRSTWWVRDYQLSGAHMPTLLDALLQSGQARPDRIMLNGALVWQRSSLTQRVNNGD